MTTRLREVGANLHSLGTVLPTVNYYSNFHSFEVISMRPFLIDATIVLWEQVARKLLPTPTKFHYQFNIRELARVFGGICAVAQKHDYKVIANSSNLKEKIPSNLFLIGLWRHECERTFVDKLINH